MSERITVTGQIPEESGSPGWVSTTPIVTEIRVVNMLDNIGKLVLHLGNSSSIALTPQQWDVVINCLVDAVGPTRSLKIDFDDVNRTATVKKVPVVTKSGANDIAEVTVTA
jgi:hypothetical protein